MSGANHHWCACNKPWSKACHESAQQDNSTSNDVHDSRWWGNTRKENRNPSQGTRAGVTHDSCWVGILLRAYYERLFKLNCRWLTSRCMECAKYLVGLVRLVNWVANLYLYHNKLMKRRQIFFKWEYPTNFYVESWPNYNPNKVPLILSTPMLPLVLSITMQLLGYVLNWAPDKVGWCSAWVLPYLKHS